MTRVYNFSAGPATLPESVLKKAADEMLDYNGTGMSVMEMSHRSKAFDDIIKSAEAVLRELLNIPDNYHVLFLQGGASTQFAMVPMNIMTKNGKADYVHTGAWSKKAIPEAERFGTVNIIASSEDKNYTYIPELNPASFTKDADYFYIVTNNTIYGTRYTQIPDTGNVPIVADMSSNILSEEIDVNKFGIIFAGAQKNIGPAGVTIIIIRDDLVGNAPDTLPTMLNYKTHVSKDSLFNTPPCYNIYIAKLVFDWLKNNGGIKAMQAQNEEKAALLYDYLDQSDFFKGTAEKKDRSLMNVPFVSPDADLDKQFIAEAEEQGLKTLKGHRSVGGMRASIYNAMPVDGVKKLVGFMKNFEQTHK
ncbi:MAG: 3-phosphoserine/phosphohydroxythreonine transaminase [candidate division KSB1 bacterium]|nr:3-phosphoserine/phosphohydroxythreonine transaminase [candidate division KSB1 bacterium]